jgi:hypothetical protein
VVWAPLERSLASVSKLDPDRDVPVTAFRIVGRTDWSSRRVENGTDSREQIRLPGVGLANEGAKWAGRERDVAGASEAAHADLDDAEP